MRPAMLLSAVCVTTAIAAGACSRSHDAPASPPPWWHVARGFVRDDVGRAVVMRGANVGNKSKPYVDFHGPADFQRMRDAWGMNAVRLLVLWAGVEPASGQYDDRYLDALAQRVEWAQGAGLLVVLDMHQDIYGEGFNGDGAPLWTCDAAHYAAFKPATQWFFDYLSPEVIACVDGFYASPDLRAHYAESWRRVAARLAGYANVIGFDVMNEPPWGSAGLWSFEETTLQPFYVDVVRAVREVAPHFVAFLEPSASRNLGRATGLTRFPFGDVVYAPHSYDTDAERGSGFDPAHRDFVIQKIAALADEAKSLDAALWIGEFGGTATSPGIGAYMTAEYDGFGAVAASSMYWSYAKSNGYGLLNLDGSEKTALLDVVVRPYPERVAGDPVSFAYDAATSTFSFTYAPDDAIAAPTLLSIPARLYPGGFSVDCGGCAYDKTAGGVSITHAGAARPAVVTIRP